MISQYPTTHNTRMANAEEQAKSKGHFINKGSRVELLNQSREQPSPGFKGRGRGGVRGRLPSPRNDTGTPPPKQPGSSVAPSLLGT